MNQQKKAFTAKALDGFFNSVRNVLKEAKWIETLGSGLQTPNRSSQPWKSSNNAARPVWPN